MTTTKQVRDYIPNPEGKGGFQDRPQDRSDGRWDKADSISYQYSKLLRMGEKEFEDFVPETVAQRIALVRLNQSIKADGLADTREVTDRTEGKAPQFIGLGDKEDYNIALVEFINGDDKDTDTPGV